MLIHPQFNPVALQLGPVGIHWYGLMYLVGFMLFFALGNRRIKSGSTFMTTKGLDDLLFWGVLGVVLGGRLGYVFFYKPAEYLAHPLNIIKAWEGGMSFHGGFIGVLVAMWLFARREKRSFWDIADFVAPLVPLGLAAGRLGNFINGELWGRVTSPDAPWAMLFPQSIRDDYAVVARHPELAETLARFGGLPRHPSQLYEFALEGVALFIMLWFASARPRPRATISALFLLGYGSFRFIAEYAREPDNFLGLLTFNMSMGQWLSLPMVVIGAALLLWSRRQPVTSGR